MKSEIVPFTRLDRYIFKELLSPFGTAILALSLIVFTKEMLRLVDLLVAKGVGGMSLLKIIAFMMPSFLVLTLPIACLIASISAMSRLSFDHEVVAMRAVGISLWRMSLPVFIFSLLVFFLTVFLSQWGQPWSNVSLKRLALSLVQDQLTLALESGVFNEPVSDMTIYVPDPRETPDMHGVFIADRRDPSQPLIIVAQSFQVLNSREQDQLGIRLLRGAIHSIPEDPQQFHQVEFQTYDLWMDLPTSDNIRRIQRHRYEDMIQKLDESNWTDTGALRRLMEYYKDLGFPAAALLLGMLGLPVGLVSKRSGRAGGFAIGVCIIVGFYLLNMLGEFLVTSLIFHPFVGAWLPNTVILVITVSLYVQASRK